MPPRRAGSQRQSRQGRRQCAQSAQKGPGKGADKGKGKGAANTSSSGASSSWDPAPQAAAAAAAAAQTQSGGVVRSQHCSKESRAIQEPLPLDVAYKVLQRLLACFRPTANYLNVAHVEHPDPETAIWQIGKDEKIDLAIVSGMIKAAMSEHQGTALKQNLASRSASETYTSVWPSYH